MDRTVAVVVAAVVGGVVVTQGPLNSQLARSVGGLQATVVALGISFTAILAASLLTGGIGDLRHLGEAPWYAVIGGGLAGALSSAASCGPSAHSASAASPRSRSPPSWAWRS